MLLSSRSLRVNQQALSDLTLLPHFLSVQDFYSYAIDIDTMSVSALWVIKCKQNTGTNK